MWEWGWERAGCVLPHSVEYSYALCPGWPQREQHIIFGGWRWSNFSLSGWWTPWVRVDCPHEVVQLVAIPLLVDELDHRGCTRRCRAAGGSRWRGGRE